MCQSRGPERGFFNGHRPPCREGVCDRVRALPSLRALYAVGDGEEATFLRFEVALIMGVQGVNDLASEVCDLLGYGLYDGSCLGCSECT